MEEIGFYIPEGDDIISPNPITGAPNSWIRKDEYEMMLKFMEEREKTINNLLFYGEE